jgi:hypothetical protein
MKIPYRLSKSFKRWDLFTELGSGFIIEVGDFKYFPVSTMLNFWPQLVKKSFYTDEGLIPSAR